jgi:hypothetical protein
VLGSLWINTIGSPGLIRRFETSDEPEVIRQARFDSYAAPEMSRRLRIGKKRRAIVSLMNTTGGLVTLSCRDQSLANQRDLDRAVTCPHRAAAPPRTEAAGNHM